MSDLEFDKVIIFIESLKTDYKNDVLTGYKDVINAIDNDSDFIMTTSFLNLSMDLILKKKYRILIQLNVSDDEIKNIYTYESLGFKSAFEIKLNSKYGEDNTFTENDDLIKLYTSGILHKNLNRYEYQECNYHKFTDKNIKRTYNIMMRTPVNSEYRRESIRYQLSLTGLVEFPYLPSVQMTGGFVPLLLEWYRNSESKNRNVKKKELLEYVNEYYNCIPEYLEKEFLYCSDTEELRIKHFPFIYHLVMSYQNSKRIDDI
jgi:hypothetical protein